MTKQVSFLILFLALAIYSFDLCAATDNTTTVDCTTLIACSNCTTYSYCGWCPGNDAGSQCVPGNLIRPQNGTFCKNDDYRVLTCVVNNVNAAIIAAAVIGTVIPACLIAYCCAKRMKRKMREGKLEDRKAFIRMADRISTKYGDGKKLDVHKTAHLWK